jgi:hypothetical protein
MARSIAVTDFALEAATTTRSARQSHRPNDPLTKLQALPVDITRLASTNGNDFVGSQWWQRDWFQGELIAAMPDRSDRPRASLIGVPIPRRAAGKNTPGLRDRG